jgi:hypothetical protein
MAHLHVAQALDANDKRAEATTQYRLVLSRPEVYDSHDEAREGLGQLGLQPCDRENR